MARPPLASPDDVIPILGAENPDISRLSSLCEQASAIVRAFAGRTWLDDTGQLAGVPDDIPGIVVAMVDRATSNPGGVVQETAGPFSRSFGPEASARLYLTRAEKLVIRAAVGSHGLRVISTTRGPVETPSGSLL